MKGEGRRFYFVGLFLLCWTLWLILIVVGSAFLWDRSKTDVLSSYLITGVLELLLAVPAVLYIVLAKVKLSDLFGKANAGQICAAFLIGILMLPATLSLSLFWNLLISLTGGRMLPQQFTAPETPLQLAAACAVAGLAAPLVEEPIMRGIVMRGQAAVWGRNRVIFFTSLLFVLPHAQYSGLAAMLLAGGVITALAWRTGSLWPSITAHFSFNVASICLSAAAKQLSSLQPGIAAIDTLSEPGRRQMLTAALLYLGVSVPFSIVCGVLLWAFWRYTPSVVRLPKVPGAKPGFRQYWPWLVSGALMAGLLLLNILQVYGVIKT